MTIEAVVFDIGNVLIHWDPAPVYDARIGAERRKAFFAATQIDRMNELVDLGAPFRPTVETWAALHPDWRDEIMMWHDLWIEFARPEITHSVKLMRALRAKGIPVFSLTNFGVETYDYAAEFYPFLREFDRDFISGHLRLIKPDPAIYEALETGAGLSGEQLVFADDRADNIAAARARGWNAHLFEGPEGWAACLVGHGLLTEDEARA